MKPGAVVAERTASLDELHALVREGAVVAAGLDRARTREPAPPVLWAREGSELLVHVSNVRVETGTGFVDVVVPVECDQSGAADVSVTFVTGAPDRPAGALAATEDRPRGPEAVVSRWHEALIALAWHALAHAASSIARTAGTDAAGRPLIVASLVASDGGIAVRPMAQHVFASREHVQ